MVKRDVWGIPWGHPVGLKSLLMIHKAYLPVYKVIQFFLPEVVKKVLADLKSSMLMQPAILLAQFFLLLRNLQKWFYKIKYNIRRLMAITIKISIFF